MDLVPKRIFFTKGVGTAREKLASFELALRDAGVAVCNLVRVSSVFPPGCRIITKAHGLRLVQPGAVTFCVMAEESTNEPSRLIAASIGLALPDEPGAYGYLSEHHCFGMTDEKAGEFAEDLAATMLATTLGIEFDPDKNYDERKDLYRMSGRIVTSRNITQSARGNKEGRWTTVVAMAIFLT